MRWINYPRLGVAVVSLAIAQQAPARRRMAVVKFDNSSVQSGAAAIRGTHPRGGKGIPDLIAGTGRLPGVEAISIGSITQFGRDDESTTDLGKATLQAVAAITIQLQNDAGSIQAGVVTLQGLVADARGGQPFVQRTGREIRERAAGQVIRRIEESPGAGSMTEVDELCAVSNYAGCAPSKTGGTIRN